MLVYFNQPALPFIIPKSEIVLRPKSYVKLPVNFIPTAKGQFTEQLIAQSANGANIAMINLVGYAYD